MIKIYKCMSFWLLYFIWYWLLIMINNWFFIIFIIINWRSYNISRVNCFSLIILILSFWWYISFIKSCINLVNIFFCLNWKLIWWLLCLIIRSSIVWWNSSHKNINNYTLINSGIERMSVGCFSTLRASSMTPSTIVMPSLLRRFKANLSVLNASSGILPPRAGNTCSRNICRFC